MVLLGGRQPCPPTSKVAEESERKSSAPGSDMHSFTVYVFIVGFSVSCSLQLLLMDGGAWKVMQDTDLAAQAFNIEHVHSGVFGDD